MPAPEVAFRPSRLDGIQEYSCAKCHADLVREWAATAHGLSWVDEVYQEALARRRRPALCYPCHVPEPLLVEGLAKRPRARQDLQHLGVSCEACHLGDDGVILGPRGNEVDAHVSRRSEHLTGPGSNALCSTCHATNIGPVIGVAKDFASSRQAERGRSCVGCHMAPVEREWAAEGPRRLGRSHALQTPRDPAFLRQAFDVAWTAEPNRIVIKNRAGHRVPGLIGRELVFRASLLDESASIVDTAELTISASAYLPVDGMRELRLEGVGHAVHVMGEHVDPRSDQSVVFLDEHLSPAER